MSMIEKVARAIQNCPYPATNIDKAKAAIAAMREPTEEMLNLWHKDYVNEHTLIYQDFIDAALKE